MKKWLRVLLFADFFILVAAGMLVPIYAVFVEEIGGDILDASTAWAIFAFTSGILILVISKWEDQIKHLEKMVFFGYLLRCIAFLGYFFVANKYELFLVQVIIGVSVAISVPAYDSLYSKLLDKGKFASQWGAWEGLNLIGGGIAAIIGGVIVTFFGFKALFLVMFVFSLIGLLLTSTLFSKKFKLIIAD